MIEKVELFKKYRKVYYEDGMTKEFPIFDFLPKTDEDMKAFKEQRAFVRKNTGTDLVFKNLDYLNEKITKSLNNAIQKHLDTQAQSLRYDDINAIGKYVGYDNDFRTEAEKLGAWASSCWKVAGEIEADVKAGNRDMPTVDEVLNELPKYGGE